MEIKYNGIFLILLILCLYTTGNEIPADGNAQVPIQNIDITPEGKTTGNPLVNNQVQVEPQIPEMNKEAEIKKEKEIKDKVNDDETVKNKEEKQNTEEKPNFKMVYDSFDPYEGYEHNQNQNHEHEPDHDEIPLDRYDFDPSEGLSFLVNGRSAECFYEEIKHAGDKLEGAYIVLAEVPEITLTITSPSKEVLFHNKADGEDEYTVKSKEMGIFELCFVNDDSENKLVTHVTNTLQSQHPVQKEHVDGLSKYVSHIDIRLGELESEQRLLQLRTERHLKIQEKMNLNVSFYAVVICVFYLLVCWAQNYYIQRLLENPYRAIPTTTKSTSRRWA